MGGNTIAIDRKKTKVWKKGQWVIKHHAQKIDISKINRKEFKQNIFKMFSNLNDKIKEKYGEPLWKDFSIFENNYVFNGSSQYLFDESIPDDEFQKYKPFVGDIDVTIPKEKVHNLFSLLLELEEKPILNEDEGNSIFYLGNNRKESSEMKQINAVFKYNNNGNPIFFQIDFEPTEYENDKPTEWSKFAYSSHWEDIKKGIKGLAHKYGLSVLANLESRDFKRWFQEHISNSVSTNSCYLVTPSVVDKFKEVTSTELGQLSFKDEMELDTILKELAIKKDNKKLKLRAQKALARKDGKPVTPDHYLRFDVVTGLKIKLEPVLTKDGKQVVLDNKVLFHQLKTKDATLITKKDEIFKTIFGREPEKDDLDLIESYTGLLKIINKFKSNDNQYKEDFLNLMVLKKLWGEQPFYETRSQELEKFSKEIDSDVKWKIVNNTIDELQVGNKELIKRIADNYYKNWQGGFDGEDEFISESQESNNLPKTENLKLNEIFEVMEINKIGD